ncbi:MAG: nucleotidyl transferase AbiEii/AbiGii toxin family protein [Bdellovibrionota bacterium]
MKAQALKESLKVIAKEKGISFNETWKQFLLERFLARLSASKHQEKFVFKGGLLLAQYLTIGRETTDVDFLARKIKLQEVELRKAIEEIISTKTEDGFTFSWEGSEELTQPHMAYPGIELLWTLALKT